MSSLGAQSSPVPLKEIISVLSDSYDEKIIRNIVGVSPHTGVL